jgi:hypothetical protein
MAKYRCPSRRRTPPWNKGRITGQKHPLKPKDVWSTRMILLNCDLTDTMLDVVEPDLHRLTETPEVQIAEAIYCYTLRD